MNQQDNRQTRQPTSDYDTQLCNSYQTVFSNYMGNVAAEFTEGDK